MENKDLKFIDIHCHYDELSLAHLKETFSKEEIMAIANNVDIDSYRKLESFRKENIPGLYFAYGLYPDVVVNKGLKDSLNYLEIIFKDSKEILAIGEIGLDYKITKDHEIRRGQKIVFEKQLEIAKDRKLPVIIHSRYATKAVLDVLESYSGFPIILHWFTGNEKEIKTALDRGYYLTLRFNKPIIHNIKEHLKQIFIETDYPISYEGKPIEITDIKKSYEIFAKENNIDIKELKEKINNNFNKVFLRK
jgi:TatD DNase family protein